jgi:hypothetical protein
MGQSFVVVMPISLPGMLLAVGMLFMPESPRWLVRRGHRTEARAVLAQIDPQGNPDAALAEMERDLATEGHGTWGELLGPSLRPALLVGIGLAVFQQVTYQRRHLLRPRSSCRRLHVRHDVPRRHHGHRRHQRPRPFMPSGSSIAAGRKPLLITGVPGWS